MNADTLIPVTISGRVYQAKASDCLGELVGQWGMKWTSITPSFVVEHYGMAEEYALGFCEYVRTVACTPIPVGCR